MPDPAAIEMQTPSPDRALVLHTTDLRVLDNRPLVEAHTRHETVFSAIVIDPHVFRRTAFDIPRFSARRVAWYLDAVRDLRRTYRAKGGDLVVRVGEPVAEVRRLVEQLGASVIYAQAAKTDEERKTLRALEEGVPQATCEWRWNDVLVDPPDWPVPPSSFPRSFTGFRKKFEQRCTVPQPLEAPQSFASLAVAPGEIPSLESLGFTPLSIDSRSPIAPLEAGETGAWRQLDAYVWRDDRLRVYKETRNGMTGWGDSSKLSPYLALGLISPAAVFHQVLAYEAQRVANASTYWLRFELLWREYFHAMALACGNRLFHRSGVKRVHRPWSSDHATFVRWTEGRTGCAIVDACMRELAATGFSSNRARQIAASFLTHYLGIDWRWGAAWFEHHLIDHDPCSNWGNWQYVAGVGTGPRDRPMSMRFQAERYDADGSFRTRWLPETQDWATDALHRSHPEGPDAWVTPTAPYSAP